MKVEEIKANELVEKYQKQKVSILYYENSIPNIVHSEMVNKSAIQCAIICVEEIIKFHNTEFWQEVLTILKSM